MYYPYFRGKQFELIVVRDMAKLFAESQFTPIIEPVRDNFNGLRRALDEVCTASGKIIVIVNPQYGAFKSYDGAVIDFLNNEYAGKASVRAGVLLTKNTVIDDLVDVFEECETFDPVFIHSGFSKPKELVECFGDEIGRALNIFIEEQDRLMYRRYFNRGDRVLVNDGFNQMRNADYPPVEEFSDLHLTYMDRAMNGYGDFLIVGDAYSETGGPAYAVAIHLTFINSEQDDIMYIYHFVSDDRNSPGDPAGKFAQSLEKLIEKLDSGSSMLEETEAIKEFRQLHEKGHFPGLGTVKKLSMMHHLETLSIYHGKGHV